MCVKSYGGFGRSSLDDGDAATRCSDPRVSAERGWRWKTIDDDVIAIAIEMVRMDG